jgi:hypothetical protein
MEMLAVVVGDGVAAHRRSCCCHLEKIRLEGSRDSVVIIVVLLKRLMLMMTVKPVIVTGVVERRGVRVHDG